MMNSVFNTIAGMNPIRVSVYPKVASSRDAIVKSNIFQSTTSGDG